MEVKTMNYWLVKKVLHIVLSLSLMMFVLTPTIMNITGLTTTLVYISGRNYNPLTDETTITLSVETQSEFLGFEFDMEYDSQKFTYKSIQIETPFVQAAVNTSVQNQIRVAVMANAFFSGNGSIAKVVFSGEMRAEVMLTRVLLGESSLNLTYLNDFSIEASHLIIVHPTQNPTLNISFSPSDASIKDVEFKSLNEDVLNINSFGEITPISDGEAVIQVTSKDNQIIRFITLKVELDLKGPTFVFVSNPTDLTNQNVELNITWSDKHDIKTIKYLKGYHDLNTILSEGIDVIIDEPLLLLFEDNDYLTIYGEDIFGNPTLSFYQISNIDKTPPVIVVLPYTTDPTNQDITVTVTTDKGTLNQESYTFTENGSFTFIATDEAGNVSEKTVTITNIDKIPPVITVEEYTTTPTNQNITVSVTTNEGTLNQTSYTFTENGSFTFIATDEAGNVTEKTVIITNIDKTLPIVEGVEDQRSYNTNRIIVFDKGQATLNGVPIESGFEVIQEGNYELYVIDEAGNSVTISFIIDKTPPVITVEDYISTPTNQDITVSVTTNEGTLNQSSYTFTENGSFTFIAIDEAGNISEKTITITNIDKVAPVIVVLPYTTDPTNQDITVTVTTDKGTLNQESYTFTENGSFTFIVTDEAGNVSENTVTITNIDKIPPVITVEEYTTTPTNQNITVSVTTNKGTLNQSSYTFTENGSFTFIATDEAGNVTEKTVTITNIDKTPPVITVEEYTTTQTNQDITVSVSTNKGTLNQSSYTFTENGSFTFVASDEAGNVTEETVTITNIDKVAPVITILPYTTNPINQDIIVTAITNEGTLNQTSYTFTENGSFTFIASDEAGNVTEKTVTITNIDKLLPKIEGVEDLGNYNTNRIILFDQGNAALNGVHIESGFEVIDEGGYELVVTTIAGSSVTISFIIDKTPPVITVDDYITTPTNQDITVSVTTSEGTLNQESYTFTENGSFTFIATDEAGNISEKTVTITNIDKTPPVITVGEYITIPTNQNITVSVTTNEGTLNQTSYTFTENGSFTFIATDEAGNVSEKTVIITNIDKTLPIVEGVEDQRSYNTNRIIVFDKGQATLNGVPIESGFEVIQEGNYELYVIDEAGNSVTISFIIDKAPPVITVEDYISTPTNQDITVSVTTNEGTLNQSSYTFTENGSFTFIAIDEAGNVTEKTVTITNIDKVAPIITILPYNTYPTDQNITVEATTNEGSLNQTSYTFTENGSFTFIATDEAGNVSEKTVTITNIIRDVEVSTSIIGAGGKLELYVNNTIVTTNKVPLGNSLEVKLIVESGYRLYELKVNGVVVDITNNTITISTITEPLTIQAEFLRLGDLNGDGVVSTTDLVTLRRFLAGLTTLDSKGEAAADLDGNGSITTTDLVRLRRQLAGLE
jgi:hypothetical protein